MSLYTCEVKFNDSDEIFETTVKDSLDIIEEEDDSIFFYCNSETEIQNLMQEDNGEDFIILTYLKID